MKQYFRTGVRFSSSPPVIMRFWKIALDIESGVKTFFVLTPFWCGENKAYNMGNLYRSRWNLL